MRVVTKRKGFLILCPSIAFAIIVPLSVLYSEMKASGNLEISTFMSIPKAPIVLALADIPLFIGTFTPYDALIQTYPPPRLVNPAPGEIIVGNKPTRFSWEWNGILQEDERFELRIKRLGKPYKGIGITCERCFYLDSPTDGFGPYEWQVVIVQLDASGNKLILRESPWSQFTWTAQPSPDAMVAYEGGLRLRYGPGIDYNPPISYLSNGEILKIQGRNITEDWILVESVDNPGKFGWASAGLKYVKIYIDLKDRPIVALASAPTLTKPEAGATTDSPNRLGLAWTWDGTLKSDGNFPNDYFRVEIWNGYNNFTEPIDVAWVQVTDYAYEQVNLPYHPEYRWRVTVIRGIPAGTKSWSTQVWEPSNRFILVSEESEIRHLTIRPPESENPLPSTPTPDDDDDDNGGGGSVPGG